MPAPEIRPEERLLGALLRNPKAAPDVSIRASALWFLSPTLETAFTAAVEYACESGAAPTRAILLELMGRRSPSDQASHAPAVDRILALPAPQDEAKHIPYYCELLERDWKSRTAKSVMLAAADMLDKGEIDLAVESLQKDLSIPLTRFTKSELGSDFGAFWSDYERIAKDPARRFGVPVGFRTVDEATKGHFNKELWVMVGGAGVGKSLWLGQVAVNTSLSRKRVLLVTIENSREAYMRRLYSNICDVQYQDLKTASLSEGEKEKLFTGIASLPQDFCLEVVHMEPPCCARDIVNIMRSAGRAYDYLIVDQITNMSPNHPRDFKVMDWRWYSQIALELRVIASFMYSGRGIPVHTAVHASGGTTDKKELTTDDTALAKSIGYHADGMLYITRKDGEFLLGKSKLRDAHFEPFQVFPSWHNWRLAEEPSKEKYGQTVDEGSSSPAPASGEPTFDVDALERESLELAARDTEVAAMGETVPEDFTPQAPPPPSAAPDAGGIDPKDL